VFLGYPSSSLFFSTHPPPPSILTGFIRPLQNSSPHFSLSPHPLFLFSTSFQCHDPTVNGTPPIPPPLLFQHINSCRIGPHPPLSPGISFHLDSNRLSQAPNNFDPYSSTFSRNRFPSLTCFIPCPPPPSPLSTIRAKVPPRFSPALC